MEEETLLSPGDRRQMLEDIGRIGLTLGRQCVPDLYRAAEPPITLRSDPAPSAETGSPLERLALLRTLWPALESALCTLARQADSRPTEAVLPTSLARAHGGSKTIRYLVGSPQALAAWSRSGSRASQRSPPFLPPTTLPEARAVTTHDTRANRFVVSLLLALEQEQRSLSALAALCGEEELARIASIAAASVRRHRSSPPLQSVGPLLPSEQKTGWQSDSTLRCSAPYRALADLGRRLFAPLRFDWTDTPLLELPAQEGWRLYEIWCFLQVAAALHSEGWRAVEGDVVRLRGEGLRLVLQTGRTSRIRFLRSAGVSPLSPADSQALAQSNLPRSFKTPDAVPENSGASDSISLFYQALFPSANQTSRHPLPPPHRKEAASGLQGFSSRSHAMQPDITLLCRGRLYLLDPKYRAYGEEEEEKEPALWERRRSGALQDDIDKMHAYRDAILSQGQNAVEEAWCLYPGRPDAGTDLIAYPAQNRRQPFGAAGLGALRLRPGGDSIALRALLRRWTREEDVE